MTTADITIGGGDVDSVDLAEIARNEISGFRLFKERYEITHKPPQEPEAWSLTSLGFMFIAMLLQSAMAVILASMRTAKMFYVALAGEILNFGDIDPAGALEAFSALFAIEFGIVLYAVAREQRRYDVGRTNENVTHGRFDSFLHDHPNFWLNVATIAMVVISVAAGFGESLSIIDNLNQAVLKAFQWILAFSLGVGASLVAYVSGEVLGHYYVQSQRRADDALAKYDREQKSFEAGLLEEWEISAELQVIRADIIIASQVANQERLNAVARVRSVRKNSKRTNEHRTHGGGSSNLKRKPPVKKEAVFTYIDAYVRAHKTIPENKDIIENCGVKVAKSTVSENLKEWRSLHPEIDEETGNG